jgi:2'-5' RNA ligase
VNDDELEALLEELEASLTAEVQAALTLTAQDFAAAVEDATELVAARFSVSRIGAMWKRRVSGLVTKLKGVAQRGARTAAEDVGEELPDGWDSQLGSYVEATTALLNAVGDRLAAEATEALAEGLNAGETVEQLKARLTALFAADGTQLGTGRAERIAMTEATRAWNAGTLAAAQAMTSDERPLVKQWHTRRDDRVRIQHSDTDGQLQLLDDPFDVAGTPMQYPGDPTAPADLTVNCRCILKLAGRPTEGNNVTEDVTAAADGSHTSGAMIALIPTEEDAARLAIDGGEAVEELHLTLFFLGAGADWDGEARADLVSRVAAASRLLGPVEGNVFGAAQWNPGSDEPAWVWNVGHGQGYTGTRLHDAYFEAQWALEDRISGPDIPPQYEPWAPHICAQYTSDNLSDVLAAKVGPVTFDRIRVVFAGDSHDFQLTGDKPVAEAAPVAVEPLEEAPRVIGWSTPGGTALAFENQQTGDGRVFAPGALYWTNGPWPLQYADEMNGGHDGARLAGAIHGMGRDGGRIPGSGVLYPMTSAGWEAAMLLAEGAPLGVSVDLDDVDLEMVDATGDVDAYVYRSRLVTASLLPLSDGGWTLTGETATEWTASGVSMVGEASKVTFHIASDGTVPRAAFQLDAAAGDTDVADGVVVDSQSSGDFLMRITRARVRGATLVAVPAYADARIVLDDPSLFASAATAAAPKPYTGSKAHDYDRVVRHVRRATGPVAVADVAKSLSLPVSDVRRYLARAVKKGTVVRISRGTYHKPQDQTAAATASVAPVAADEFQGDVLTASATGAVDLDVAPRDTDWDGDAAATRVFEWADGDTSKISQAFAYRDDAADPATKAAYKLGYADVVGGTLTIIPKGVSAALGALNGARGGVDLPQDETSAVRDKLEGIQRHVDEALNEGDDMQASAWSALADLPNMPAAWFREPTEAELPPGGPGVNYANGRIFGWVAQAGEAHAGYAKKVTIDSLGRIDTAHFLRQRFTLDDGSTVKAGAFTMNVGHHRDGAECETSACQFDSTRTVAGIVTVGMNARGMWFSGAAAPWLSEWDRQVFAACQPSYHMKKGPSGNWQLRAVLSVPVPGHSSPLLASAVAERAQLALTAAATMVEVEEAVAAANDAETAAQTAVDAYEQSGDGTQPLADLVAAAVEAALDRREAKKLAEAAELEELLAAARNMDVSTDGTEGD